jgi:4-hydroxy-tetrahydrodipicolinate reductase
MESLVWCKTNKVPLVIGSTGQSGTQMKEIENASKSIAIFKAGNFSVGIKNLKNALKSLIINDAQEITIFEKHHKNKKDAPSGTAKEIAEYIGKKFNKPVNIIFERGGKEIGTHSVDIYYENEVVSISHKVFSRDAFADGVRKAVDFMIGCKVAGLYSMEDIKF